MKIGARIAILRKSRGLSQKALAAMIGRHCTALSRWERGLVLPRADDLQRLSAALGVTLEDIAGKGKIVICL